MDTLRISPKYTSGDWTALDRTDAADRPKAVAIVRDRLHGRFLHFADKCLKDEFSGFVVLSIDCLLVETLQQFIDGITDGHGKSTQLSKKFLKGPRFQPAFDTDKVRGDFYSDIRCGLLHQAEAKNKWLIHRKQPTLLKKVGTDGYIIDVERFHAAVKNSLNDYLTELCKPESADLRTNLWTKMNHICNVRTARGAMYGSQSPSKQAP
jgi:hypothetical protein